MVDRRFGDVEDEQRAHGDAELRAGQHQSGVLHGPQRGLSRLVACLGLRLDLCSPRGQHRELGANEERVGCQQHHQPPDAPPWTHGSSRRSSTGGGACLGTKRNLSTRRPSMLVTIKEPAGRSTVSPRSGTLPRSAMTQPPLGSWSSSSALTSPLPSSTSSRRNMPGSDHESSGACLTPGSRLSCSSATSPINSSTRSSSVTIPAVPPYSSSTTAICRLKPRNCPSNASSASVSGTISTS